MTFFIVLSCIIALTLKAEDFFKAAFVLESKTRSHTGKVSPIICRSSGADSSESHSARMVFDCLWDFEP